MRRVLVLGAGVLLCWGLAAYPAWVSGGPVMLLQSALAACLCLVAAAATLACGQYVLQQAPDLSIVFVVGSMGFRMLFVLAAALVLTSIVPSLRGSGLWLWIVAFYLLTLALETTLLVRGRASARPRRDIP